MNDLPSLFTEIFKEILAYTPLMSWNRADFNCVFGHDFNKL